MHKRVRAKHVASVVVPPRSVEAGGGPQDGPNNLLLLTRRPTTMHHGSALHLLQGSKRVQGQRECIVLTRGHVNVDIVVVVQRCCLSLLSK